MTQPVYETTVYSTQVEYTNLNGVRRNEKLSFAMDPLTLLSVIAAIPMRESKSGDPRKSSPTMSDEAQLRLIRDLAETSWGHPSNDGEMWVNYEDLSETLAGKAFLTRLTTSESIRREFTDNVLVAPMRAFVSFAKSDPTNSPKDIQEFELMLARIEKVFTEADNEETLEERRSRLQAELQGLSED